jgi:hypothetical protein
MMMAAVKVVALSLALAGLSLYAAKGDDKVDTRVFELRTYTATPGNIDALHARFRDHTLKLFEKHHMTLIGFWKPTDAQQAKRQLVYLLAFPARTQRQRVGRIFRLTRSGRL